jgi:hypothetical protein
VPSESLSLFHTTSICKVGGDFMSAPTAPIVKACNTSRSREHHNRHTHRDTPTSNAPYSDPVVRETPTPTRSHRRRMTHRGRTPLLGTWSGRKLDPKKNEHTHQRVSSLTFVNRMLRSRVGGSLSLMSLPHSALIGLLQDLDKAMAASNWGTVCDVLGTLKSTPVTFASIKVAARASVAI